MKRLILTLACSIIASLFCSAALAAQVRVYVEPFSVTGVKDKDDLKSALQLLLASRVSGDQVIAVDKAADADLVVASSYLAFGPVYSLDAAARDKAGKVVARAFEQGEDMNQLIPTVSKLGKKLGDEIAKLSIPESAKPAVVAIPAPKPSSPEIVRKEAAPKAVEPEFIKPQEIERNSATAWTSQRLTGSLVGIAPGKTLPDGQREIFVVNDHVLRLYLLNGTLKMVSEVSFKSHEKLLGVDTADLDNDGNPEAYVTIMDRETLQSQVWISKGGKLQQVADRLPYYFRAIETGGTKKIYLQQIGADSDFYGDVAELAKVGDRYEMKNPIKLPRFGFLYNFNIFTDTKGEKYTLVFSEDGYLIVYDVNGEELWRSSDKFGGSETYFKREDLQKIRITGDQFRWQFLEQRIIVTKDGEIIVPKNTGTFVIGNNRSFNKHSIYCFTWNGTSLEEKWHTREAPQYLSDFFYDDARKELVLLQVVKKDGMIKEGSSVIAVKKVE
ncbi:MAG: VCBS repeat-containing protein [Geobacter sp.]|nr:VCBS repeat-containing protein [Geobacter sp.]